MTSNPSDPAGLPKRVPGQTPCRWCRAPILFARMESGAFMPISLHPDPTGNVAAFRDAHGQWCGRVLVRDDVREPHEHIHRPHFADCPNYPPNKRKLPANVKALPTGRERADRLRARRGRG